MILNDIEARLRNRINDTLRGVPESLHTQFLTTSMIASIMSLIAEMPDDQMLQIEMEMRQFAGDSYAPMSEKDYKKLQMINRYGPLPQAIESVLDKALYIYSKPEVIN